MEEFLIDKKQVRRAFSRAALNYDAAAVLQREVCQRMLEHLDCIKLLPSGILDVGSGTGWGTRQLMQRYPAAQMIALDIAYGMLKVAKAQPGLWKKPGWWQKLFSGNQQSYVCADVEALPLSDDSVKMVWSNLALQWCNDLPATLGELHRVLKNNGLIMFSTFGPDTLKELRHAFQGVDGNSHVNQFFDMHDIGDMLVHAGFSEPVMDMEILTLTYSDVKSVMQDLRNIGANNATFGRAQGMMGKTAWRHILERYEHFRSEDKLPATFEIIYGHAWKPSLQVKAAGPQVVHTSFKL